MKLRSLITSMAFGVLISSNALADAQQTFDRTILPIQPPAREPITELDARNVTSLRHSR